MVLGKWRMLWAVAVIAACGWGMVGGDAWGKKPGKGAEAPVATVVSDTAVPADMNLASLRINALDMLYELDLSPDQLDDFAAAGTGAASAVTRSAVKPNEKLIDLFTKMQTAIVTSGDDQTITTLRNQIIDFVNSNNVELDDTVRTTAAAHAAATGLCAKLKASQIAAFLAMHADEVGDPEEMMFAALATLRDARANPDLADPNLAAETATNVGYLVAGMDDAKAKGVADQVATWLKAGLAVSDDDFVGEHVVLSMNAKKIVDVAGPMDVLTHWMQQQVAILLSNPEGGEAVKLMMSVRKAAN